MAEKSTALAIVKDRGGLMELAEQMKQQIKDVLPRHITPDRVLKMIMVAASRNPVLFQCTQQSLCQAMMRSSELGLDCSGTLGYGYIIPFRNNKTGQMEAQFIPGYKGLIDLALRGESVIGVEARVVHKNDAFDFSYGLEPTLTHKPTLDKDAGPSIAFYAVATLTTGQKQFEVMRRDQIDGIRARSRAKDSGPWVTDYDQMGRKTVIRRLCNYLKLRVEDRQAIEESETIEFGGPIVDEVKERGATAVVDRLKKARQPTVPGPQEQPPDADNPPVIDPGTGEVLEATTEPVKPTADDPDAKLRTEIQDVLLQLTGDEVKVTGHLKTVYGVLKLHELKGDALKKLRDSVVSEYEKTKA